MELDDVAAYAESLRGVKRKGTATRPGWYVDDRLVARLADAETLLVRVPLDRREALLEAAPSTFGVPPRMESHHKVEVYLDRAVSPSDVEAVRTAIRLAWERQRRS
jgi:hypothetical protein